MISLIKKLHVAFVLAVVLALPLVQVPTAYPAELTASEKVLSFLTDVVRLDMTKYNAQQTGYFVEYPSDLGGLPQEVGRYTLESDESKIDVTYKFRNKTLSYCKIYVLKGSPLYAQPSTNVLDAAKDFLDRYQTYATASYFQIMRNMLDTVTEIKTMTTTSGNVKLKVSTEGDYTYFSWMYTSNGLDFTRKGTYIYFEQGHLTYFGDGWYLYKIGSDKINVSEEEAISIARNATKDMPKLYSKLGNGTVIEVQPKVADEPVETELMIGIREPLTLYPLWHVQLYFDKLYGNYYGVAVDIWADTGEISGTPYGTGIMGGFHDEENSTPSPIEPPTEPPTEPTVPPPTETPPEETPTEPPAEPPPDNSTGQTNLNPTPLIIAVSIALAIIIGAVFYRRKRSTSSKTQ